MVAPSFQAYKVITEEPFRKNGKLYITIAHPRTGHQRDARWYTEKEYERAYGTPQQEVKKRVPIFPPSRVTNFTVEKKNPITTKLRAGVPKRYQPWSKVLIWEEYYRYLARGNTLPTQLPQFTL